MEWPWKQFELWPRPMSPEEMDKANDELRRAGNYEKRKGREVSKEEMTKEMEGDGANTARILSPKESARKAGEIIEKLERAEKERGEGEGKNKKKE